MISDLTLAPVRVRTGTADEDKQLVLFGDFSVAVLVRLAEGHEAEGQWLLEHGFGRFDAPLPPTFFDLQAAESWTAERLGHVVDGCAP